MMMPFNWNAETRGRIVLRVKSLILDMLNLRS